VLLTKLALRGAGVSAIVLVTLGLHALLGRPQAASADAGLAALVLILAVVAYTAFWLALALWVNARQFDSALNAVLLVSAWLLLVVVMPAAINATASVIHPAPARSEMVLAIRQAAIDTDRDRESEQARFQQEHAQTGAASPTSADQRRLGLLLATQSRADQVLDRHEAMVQQQRTLSDRLAFLNPPMLINDLLAEVAGNGQTRWDAHLQEVKAFHATWQNYFVALAQRGSRVGLEDMAQWPRWPNAARAAMSAQSSARVLPTLVWVGVCAFVLVLLSQRSLARVA
jgi:ABC-2 type transport system permease protein